MFSTTDDWGWSIRLALGGLMTISLIGSMLTA